MIPKTKHFSLSQLAINFSLSFFILALGLVGLELYLRYRQNRPLTILACRRPDFIYNHGFVPSSKCQFRTNEWNLVYQINALGLRDIEFSVPKPANTKRILVLGDSFVEGYGVELSQTFVKGLENRLNELHTGSQYQVINAGIMGFSPLLEYLYLKEEGIYFEPDLVILAFDLTDFHDDYVNYAQAVYHGNQVVAVPDYRLRELAVRKFQPPSAPVTQTAEKITPTATPSPTPDMEALKFTIESKTLLPFIPLTIKKLLHQSRLYSTLTVLIKQKLGQAPAWNFIPGAPLEDLFAIQRTTDPVTYQALLAAPQKSFQLLKNYLAEKNIPLVILIYPHAHQVNLREWHLGRTEYAFELNQVYTTQPLDETVEYLQENDFLVINLIPDFLAYSGPKLYFPYDGHFNIKGHQFVTDLLFQHLLPLPIFQARILNEEAQS